MTDSERDELLIRLDTKFDSVASRLDDHGKRLRALEMFRNWASGAGAVIAGIVGLSKLNVKISQ